MVLAAPGEIVASHQAFKGLCTGMLRSIILFFVTCLILSHSPLQAKLGVTGYLPEYRLDSVNAESIKGINTLIFFGIEPNAGGNITDDSIKAASIKKIADLKKQLGCKILLCVGGWNRSKHFPAIARSAATRKHFISQALSYCQKHGFDGIDYDWEHPKNERELSNYRSLLIETAKFFRTRHLKVTVAQASWQDIGEVAYRAIDQVHLMSYDHAFPQATYEKSSHDINQLIKWGCPPGKISLGIPFYGRNKARASRTYSQLVRDKSPAPATDVINGFAFNGRKTIIRKVKFAKQQELGGIMIWELGQDVQDKNLSLLQVIIKESR